LEFAREERRTVTGVIGETRRAVAILRYYAGQALERQRRDVLERLRRTLLFAWREPIGVVPRPIAIPTWKIAPTLAYGTTVVWEAGGDRPARVDDGLPRR
jgi:alpha-ketoglutaric semialdehyde dehydrogenase